MTISKNKLNKIYERPSSLSQIIRKSETSADDLKKLANKLGINIKINWVKDYDSSLENDPSIGQILNMGDGIGSHWVATYMDKYFDSFGMLPPPILTHLQYTPLTIQNVYSGGCGQYATMFIYYAMQGEIDKFYSMFDPYNV